MSALAKAIALEAAYRQDAPARNRETWLFLLLARIPPSDARLARLGITREEWAKEMQL